MYHILFRLLTFGIFATLIAAAFSSLQLPSTAPTWLQPLAQFMTQFKSALAQHSELVIVFALITAVAAIAWRGRT
jgi:Na+/H+-dicarboxylate symporter